MLPGCAIGMLYKSTILGFCCSLKMESIHLNITAGVYMQDKGLIIADPNELFDAKSMEGVDLEL